MIWRILGITPTKDKKAITRAYRDKLSSVNPEEKPEEFKELRSAYEKALEEADKVEKPAEEKSPVELWMEEVKAVYDWFPDRIDVEAWKRLLESDVCQGLDTRSDAEEALLVFMLDNYRMTKDVLVYLNQEFGFLDHMDELREKFPRDFLDFVIIDAIRYGENLPLPMFTPGLDGAACDEYAFWYTQASRSEGEELEALFEKMAGSTEKHPYGEAMLLKREFEVWMRNNVAGADQDESGVTPDIPALKGLLDLHSGWPDDDHISMDLVYVYNELNQSEKVAEICEEVIKIYPKHGLARRYLAEARAQAGEYKKAVELINQLMSDMDGDQRAIYELGQIRREWSAALGKQMEERYNNDNTDQEALFELIWSCIENEEDDKANALALQLEPEKPDAFSYYNMKAVLAECGARHEENLDNLYHLLDAAYALQPDGTEKTEKRIGRKAEIMGRIAGALINLERREGGLEMLEKSLAEDPGNMSNLVYMIQLCLGLKKYKRAASLADLYIEKGPRNAQGYALKAVTCFRMGQDAEAFQNINACIDIDGSDLQAYLLKMRILNRNRAFEEVDALVDFLEQNGIKDEPVISWCKVQKYCMISGEDKDREELEAILDVCKTIDEQLDSGEFGVLDWAAEFYYAYVSLTSDMQGILHEYPVEPLLALLDKGIKADPEDFDCRGYKAWLLKKEKRYPEALELLKALEHEERNGVYIESQLAELYYADLENEAAQALHYYKILIQAQPENADHYFYAGMSAMRLPLLEEAEAFFLNEQKYDPDDIDGYYRLSTVYHQMNRLEDELEMAKKTVELAKKRTDGSNARFWRPLVQAYKRLGRPSDAIRALEECKKYNPEWDNTLEIGDVLHMFGLYKESKEFIERCKKKNDDAQGWTTMEAHLLMLQENPQKLFTHLLYYRKVIDQDMLWNIDVYLAILKGDMKKYLQITEREIRKLKEEGRYSLSAQGDYTWALWLNNRKEEAEKEANACLQYLAEMTAKSVPDKLLYLSKRIRFLALLGREEEARSEISRLKDYPMCEQCTYCACKDLDIFETELELVLGNYDKVLKLAREYSAKWPDEFDFIQLKYLAEQLR